MRRGCEEPCFLQPILQLGAYFQSHFAVVLQNSNSPPLSPQSLHACFTLLFIVDLKMSKLLLHTLIIIFVPIIMLARLGVDVLLAVWLVAVFLSLASIECLKNGKLRLVFKSAHTRSQTATFRPPSARRDPPDQQPRLQWPTAAC